MAFAAMVVMSTGCDAVDQALETPRAAAARPDRGRVIGGERVERSVHWPRGVDRTTLAALPARSRDAVARAPAPVLIPGLDHPLAGGVVTAGSSYWTYTASRGGVTVAIHASTQAHLYPGVDPEAATAVAGDRVRGIGGRVERAEGIWTLSWIENGVAYALEIECADLGAEACRDDLYARELAGALAHVGGRGGAR